MEEGGRGRFFLMALPTLAATAIIAAAIYYITGDFVSGVYGSAAISSALCIMFAGQVMLSHRRNRDAQHELFGIAGGYAPILCLSLVLLVAGWQQVEGEGAHLTRE